MRALLAFLLALVCAAPAFAQSTPWSGHWDAHWPGGTARMELEQKGSHVTGRYPLLGGSIEGEAAGRELTGTWHEGTRTGTLTFRLSPDLNSFLGRLDNGVWWTGGRVERVARGTLMTLSSPRLALRSFLLAGGRARAGEDDELGRANEAVEHASRLPRLAALEETSALFKVIDLTTIHLYEIPDSAEPTTTVTLTQAGSGVPLKLDFHRDAAGKWHIVHPGAEALAECRTALLARDGGKPPSREAYLRQSRARDTVRVFLDAFHDWGGDGSGQAVGTLDLSNLPEATRADEGGLAALFLKQVLDRIGPLILEEINDDPANRDSVVLFRHPVGRVALAPGPDQVWRFTPDTVATIRDLYSAIGSTPVPPGPRVRGPASLFFELRHQVVLEAPYLLRKIGGVERWQVIGAVLVVLASLLAASGIGWVVSRLLRWRVGQEALPAQKHLHVPLAIALTALGWKLASPPLGLPLDMRVVTDGLSAIILACGTVWTGFLLADAITAGASRRAANSPGSMDEIRVSMSIVAFRAALVICAFLYVADRLSIPTSGIIAGLGVGGLAVAFASKETLSNVFGAAILMIDRPFRRGDSIVADSTRGTVEHVGIRSTRIRTAEDSVIVVPNGKLSDATINNMGSRRSRLVQATLVLPYSAGRVRIDAFVEALAAMLRSHPDVVPERVQVGVTTLRSDGLEIGVSLNLAAKSGTEEGQMRHDVMLDILKLADQLNMPISPSHTPSPDEAAAAA